MPSDVCGPLSDLLLDKYDDLDFSDSDDEGPNSSKMYMQKFQNKVDFSMKTPRQLKDKCDRATTDHALDRRSRAILFKMMNQCLFTEINGCISTGKEANVYHVIGKDSSDMAVKVYMTSIMPFKSRDKYVKGDFRMRHGYSKATSWKIVSKWAEKEYRNLLRISQSGMIPCPQPLKLKGVVLLMTFIGQDGIPAPKLKDASFDNEDDGDHSTDWSNLYLQIVQDVRTLYQKCRLIHADLSEYNLLYYYGKAWMIDVSQAVEHESPQALEYLRTDCYNVNTFFRKQGVSTLTLREFFEWVVNPCLPAPGDPKATEYLKDLIARSEERGIDKTIEVEDDAFRFVHIPRNLSTGYPFVKDFQKIQSGLLSPSDIYYAAVSGMKPDLSGAQVFQTPETEASESDGSDSDTGSDHCKDKVVKPKSSARPRDESPESRKIRKQAVKHQQAEKRKTKIPKYIKRKKK